VRLRTKQRLKNLLVHRHLLPHLVFGDKILARVGDDLAIGGVVNGFDADDFVDQVFVMGVDVFDQMQLGVGGADHQDLACAAERLGDVVVVLLVFRNPADTHFAAFDVQLLMRDGRQDQLFFNIFAVEVHHMGFCMVKPDDGVEVRHTWTFVMKTGLSYAFIRTAC
jgi:hypothetical protein